MKKIFLNRFENDKMAVRQYVSDDPRLSMRTRAYPNVRQHECSLLLEVGTRNYFSLAYRITGYSKTGRHI